MCFELRIFQVYKVFIRKAFNIHFDTNESNNKLILLERRFDVIFTSFSSSIKVRYFFNCSYDEFVIAQANNYIKSQSHAIAANVQDYIFYYNYHNKYN